MGLLPEQLARIKIDKQLNEAGWALFQEMNIFLTMLKP